MLRKFEKKILFSFSLENAQCINFNDFLGKKAEKINLYV